MWLIRIVPINDRNFNYWGTFSINCKEISNFSITTILNIFKQKNLTYPPSSTENVSAFMQYLNHVFYALKHVLSEMIKIISPRHTFKSTWRMFRVKFLVTSKIWILKQCSRMNLMLNFLDNLKVHICSYAVSVKYIFRTKKNFLYM